jgi:hypothetical protein
MLAPPLGFFRLSRPAGYGFEQTPALNPGCGFPWCPGTHCLSPGPGWSAKAVAPNPSRLTPTVTTTATTRFMGSPPGFLAMYPIGLPTARNGQPRATLRSTRCAFSEQTAARDKSKKGHRTTCPPSSVLAASECGRRRLGRDRGRRVADEIRAVPMGLDTVVNDTSTRAVAGLSRNEWTNDAEDAVRGRDGRHRAASQ